MTLKFWERSRELMLGGGCVSAGAANSEGLGATRPSRLANDVGRHGKPAKEERYP
jgi:hypothetical protein